MQKMKPEFVGRKLLGLCVALAVLPLAKAETGTRAASEGACRSIRRPHEVVPGLVLVEAEDFDDYGRWRLDTQFVHKMGSAYLIAPGVGSPIGSARTTVDLPRAGRWRVWVRTNDWLPTFSPGRFSVLVGGRRSRELGASKREGWSWELAAEFDLEAGPIQLSLDDLSGAFARCDAVLLTTDLSYRPPDVVYTNASPSAVVDGVSRAVGNEAHAWARRQGCRSGCGLTFSNLSWREKSA